MLRIKKLRLKNFKSFKKAEIPIAEGFTAIAGANASGKCVSGDTLVLLENGSRERIDKIVENAIQNSEKKKYLEDGIIAFNEDKKTVVYTLNLDTLKIEPAVVNAFVKRKAPEKLLKIKMKSGREITATDYHPFFGVKNGVVAAFEAKELNRGTKIATPRFTPIAIKTKLFEELIDSINETDKVYAPFREEYPQIVKSFINERKLSVKQAAEEFGIPKVALQGLKSKQSINMMWLIKILKKTGHTYESIAELAPEIKDKNSKMAASAPWRNSKEFSRFLGYFFAEGSFSDGYVRLVNGDKEIIEDITEISSKVFGKKAFAKKYKPNCTDIIIFSKSLAKIISKFCTEKPINAKTKKLREFFFSHSSEEEICNFLNGYLGGDGHISEKGVEAVTASRELAHNIFDMFISLGVQPRIRQTTKSIKSTGFSGKYFEVFAYGLENMKTISEKIKLTHNQKRNDLSQAIARISRKHSNVDLIPGINEALKTACIEEGVQYARKKDKNVKLKAYVVDKSCLPSRNGLREVLAKEFTTTANSSATLLQLQKLAFSDVFWDEIAEIEHIPPKEPYVYDLSITQNHNFIANNIFAHNSNVMDSLLFSLGITGLKMLRVSKLTELINHDATEGYAKVEIELEHNEKPILVSRYVDTRGLSVFRVDGKRKTLSEVSSFLLELGVKPTGHNFVVQGDITRIIEMNAKQRREIIDEVAGLSEFEEKKAEAIRKLEQVEQKVKDAMIVLSEREKHLDEIEKEKAAAQKFNDLKDELALSKASILSLEAKKIESEMSSTKSKMDSLREEVTRKQADKTALFEQDNALEKKLEEINEKIIEASSKTYSTIGREIEEKKAGIKITRNSIESLEAQFSEAIGKKNTLDAERKKLLEDLEDKKGQIASLKNNVSEDSRKIAELEKKTGLLSGRALSTGGEVKKLQEAAEEIGKKEHVFREEYYQALVAHQKTLKEKEALEKNVAHFSGELEKLLRQVEEKKSLEEEAKRLSLSKPLEKLDEAAKKLENYSSEIHSLKGKIEALNEANARLTGLSSNCPTCMQTVDKKTVDRLFAQNNAKIKEIDVRLYSQMEAKKGIENQVRELEGKKNRLKELELSAKALEAAASAHAQIRQRIDGLKSTLNTLNINALDEKQAKAKQAFEAAAGERAGIALKIKELSKAPERIEFANLLEQVKSLTAQKNEKENRLNYLESEVFHGIEKRLKAIEQESPYLEKTSEAVKKKSSEFEKQVLVLQKELEKKEAELSKATQETRLLEEEKQRLHSKSQNLDEKIKDVEEKISQKEKQLNELNLAFSKNEIRHNDLTEELKQFENVKTISGKTPEELKKRAVELEKQIAELGAINMKAIERFDELKAQVVDMKEKATKLEGERRAVLEMIGKIELRKLEVFMECFAHVSRKFSDIYFHFFGGEGRLSLTDSQKPLEGGLLIEAKYKENKLKSIDSMSGGEKSLTALAFIFAIQSFDTAPFYVFDEADAALDKENSLKLGRMIKEISKNSQFITITHNDSIIKNADQIIGVALNQQKSSVIGLRVKEPQEETAQKAV